MGIFERFFRHIQKPSEEEHEFEEYTARLLDELEKLRTENARALEKERCVAEDLQKQIEKEKEEKETLKEEIARLQEKGGEDERLKGELAQMQGQVASLQARFQSDRESQAEKDRELTQMREQMKEYESGYYDTIKYISQAKRDVDDLLSNAREESAKILADAQEKAEKIVTDGKEKADRHAAEMESELKLYRFKVEKELEEKEKENEEKFVVAKYRLGEYINMFNSLQSSLMENYNEMGKLIKRMPLHIENLLLEQPKDSYEAQDESIRVQDTD